MKRSTLTPIKVLPPNGCDCGYEYADAMRPQAGYLYLLNT